MTIQPFLVVLFSLIASAVLALVVWLVRTVGDLRAILIGADGQNGVRGDLRAVKKDMTELRTARHAHGDALHAVHGELALTKLTVATLDRTLHQDVERICRDVEGLRDDLREAKDEWDGVTERRRRSSGRE